MKYYVISPRVLEEDASGNAIAGISIAAQEMGCMYRDISCQSLAPELNLHICELDLTEQQKASVSSDDRFYIIDTIKAANGDVSGAVTWLKSKNVSKTQFGNEVGKFNISIPALSYAAGLISELL